MKAIYTKTLTGEKQEMVITNPVFALDLCFKMALANASVDNGYSKLTTIGTHKFSEDLYDGNGQLMATLRIE